MNRTVELGDDANLDAEGKPTPWGTSQRDAPDVWPLLTATQKTALNTVAKRLNELAGQV